jgi:hypothetical protein
VVGRASGWLHRLVRRGARPRGCAIEESSRSVLALRCVSVTGQCRIPSAGSNSHTGVDTATVAARGALPMTSRHGDDEVLCKCDREIRRSALCVSKLRLTSERSAAAGENASEKLNDLFAKVK